MDSHTGASLRQLARIAGALYLINIVCGASPAGESVAAAAPGPGCHLGAAELRCAHHHFPNLLSIIEPEVGRGVLDGPSRGPAAAVR